MNWRGACDRQTRTTRCHTISNWWEIMSMSEHERVWVVRGGDFNELAAQVAVKHAVAIGWTTVGDVSCLHTRDAIRSKMEEAQPGSATPNAVGQVYRFAQEIKLGDFILTPERATRRIHISQCTGDYRYDPSVFGHDYPHVRPVDYLRWVERASFPVTVRNTLGSTLTVFRADTALPYLRVALGDATPSIVVSGLNDSAEEVGVWADDIEGQARGQILEALDEIEHHDFQLFVAGLLEALEYRVHIGRKGADGGVDVLAYPDVFGLASPRIKVQVKNQKTSAGMPDVGYLHGVLGSGERGLFVCTGGFTNDAKNAPFVRDGKVVLTDGNQLLDLILEHYEAIPSRAKALLPLRRVYVPEKTA